MLRTNSLLVFVQVPRVLILQELRKTDDCVERRSEFVGHVRQKFRFQPIGLVCPQKGDTELFILPVQPLPVSPQQEGRIGGDECEDKQHGCIRQQDQDLIRPRPLKCGMEFIGPKYAEVFECHHGAEADDAKSGDDEGKFAGRHHADIEDEGAIDGQEVECLDCLPGNA